MNESWIQIIVLIISILSMFGAGMLVIMSFRKESREDWIRMDKESKEYKEAIRLDIKEFHERLLQIEMERSR